MEAEKLANREARKLMKEMKAIETRELADIPSKSTRGTSSM